MPIAASVVKRILGWTRDDNLRKGCHPCEATQYFVKRILAWFLKGPNMVHCKSLDADSASHQIGEEFPE
jgi:hypothetical protein